MEHFATLSSQSRTRIVQRTHDHIRQNDNHHLKAILPDIQKEIILCYFSDMPYMVHMYLSTTAANSEIRRC